MEPDGVPLRAGDVLDGKYRLERVLGEGGMGVVFVGLHSSLEERVAIKVLHPKRASDPQIVTRFVREAKTAFKLRSEHVVRMLDVGVHPTPKGELPYIVMELLDGQDMSQRIDAMGAVPVAEAIGLVLQACEALASAHALGIVHRDLKPSNLFLIEGPDGKPFLKVLDFGISKVSDIADTAHGVTTTDAVLGSPGYMPPEQLRASRDVDARADVWSLAMVLWEMLVGKPMFDSETFPEICAKVLHGQLTPPRSAGAKIPAALETVVMRALASEPDARHPTVLAFAEAIAPFLGKDPTPHLARVSNLSKPPPARGWSVPPVSPELSTASTATSHPPPAPKRTTTPFPWGVTESRTKKPAPRWVWPAAGLVAALATVTVVLLGRAKHPVEASPMPVPSAPASEVAPATASVVHAGPVVSSVPSASVAPSVTEHPRVAPAPSPHTSASASARVQPANGAPILH